MKKFLMLMVASASVIWAGGSPFTNVRVGARDATGKPTEEIVDMAICLERIPEEGDSSIRFSKGMYERVMKLWADYFYEMSNGSVFLGNVRIYPGNLDYPACSVDWKMNNVHPNSVGNHNIGGIIHTQDNWTAIQNIDVFTTEMALVLAHESGHQVIGVKDEYGNMPEGPCGDAIFTTNPDEDYIEIDFVGQNPLNILNFTNSMRAYVPGTAVLFNADGEGVKLPDGLFAAPATNILEDGRPAYLLKKNYPIVDHVDIIKREKSIVYRLYFRTSDGEKIDIKDKGQGNWSFSLPVSGGASAHTLMNNPDMIQVAMNLGLKQIPWQWANLTTQFNLNPLSFQGLFCRDAEGTPKSAWEMVVADPQFDNENCQAPSKPRYWFKSMIGREPTEKDVYHTNSSYINYDSKTGKWQQSDATWYDANMATHTIEVDLPYMKVEIDRPEAEYAPLTRKYLNVQWINSSKTDVMVAIDWSLSMRDRNKYNQSMLALKHIAGGFMNIQDKNTQAKAKDFRLGVFLFNDGVTTLFEPTDNFTFDDVLKAIDKAPKPAGQTAMFDAIDKAISSFSNDAEASKILYVISDGRDNRSKKTKDDIVKLYESKDISIHTFSYGDDADLELLSSMAEATGGSFFEQMDSLYLKTEDAIVAVLAENPENEQVAAATVAPQAKASAILPREVSKVQIFGSSESEEASSEPLAVTTKNGAAVPFSIRKFKENGRISFVAEIDSATLASLATPYVQVASKLKKSKMDYRMVASSKRMLYQMKAKVTPAGPYVWPREGRIEASIRNAAGVLSDVEAVATLTYPDGTVRSFNLNDEGANGDNVAEDGTYSAVLPDVNANGTYQWEVRMKKGNAAVAAVAKNAVAARNAQVAASTAPNAANTAAVASGNAMAAVKNAVAARNAQVAARTAPNAASTAAIAPRTAQAAASTAAVASGNAMAAVKNAVAARNAQVAPSTAADVAGGDDASFEFIRNGQFVVTGCCTDEPSDELLELSPNKRLHAYLQADGDEDRFKIVATEATHSYSLYIKSLDLDAFDRVDVFAPSNLENPVYSVAVAAKAGELFVTIPLSNEFTMPGYVVALHGKPAAVAAEATSVAASTAAVAPGAAASPAANATASPAANATAAAVINSATAASPAASATVSAVINSATVASPAASATAAAVINSATVASPAANATAAAVINSATSASPAATATASPVVNATAAAVINSATAASLAATTAAAPSATSASPVANATSAAVINSATVASLTATTAAVPSATVASPVANATASPAAIATATATASGVNYSLALLDVTSSAFTIGRFEDATDWRADSAFATLDSRRKFEGDRSLVSAGGEKLFESRVVSTDDFELVGDRLKLNALVPASQINRDEMRRGGNRDLGNISLWCVRDGVRKQIGETKQFRYILGSWQPYEFEIPADLVKSFGEPHAEFSFQVAVNSLDSVWIDNLRFIGKLQDNPANKVEIACPGSAGCSESNPIIVPENGSVRITAKDDAWVGVNAPANENAEVVLDVTPTDGKELNGTVIIDGKTHKLSGWTWQKTSAALGKSLHRALFRNMNGRTLRFRTWQKRRGYDFANATLHSPINFAEWWSVKF